MSEPCDECGVDTVALLKEIGKLSAKLKKCQAKAATMRRLLETVSDHAASLMTLEWNMERVQVLSAK